jgi:phage gp29-like protein
MWSQFIGWIRKLAAPPVSAGGPPVVVAKPLHEQYQRIGGGITPYDVSEILRQADAGQPARLVDLMNESRQKDGHLQGVMSTRDRAVSLVDLDFVAPEKARRNENKAADLCKRIRDEFRNWPLLIQHLTGAYAYGHATAEIIWEQTDDGLLLPRECKPIHARDFIFSRDDGTLRYRRTPYDVVGVDLLAENPGRIVQLQRRIVGDVPAREGLARVLVWGALFRNWDLRDWLALGEYGWKPWRIGRYPDGAHRSDVETLLRAVEQLGAQGVGVIPKSTDINIEWPKGISGGSMGSSTHAELFDTMGRELSKAVLGQTTTTEAGPNGDRASTQTRDQVRMDIREEDCVSVAAALRYHLFMPAIAANIAGKLRVPVALFQTEEATDQRDFAQAVKLLRDAGLRIPAKWVRDELGMPEPAEDDELLTPVQVPPMPDPEEPDDDGDQEEGPDEAQDDEAA